MILATGLVMASVRPLHAQQLKQKISVEFNNTPLEEVLRELSRQSGILFSYNPGSLPPDSKITYKASGKTIETILDDILNPRENIKSGKRHCIDSEIYPERFSQG